MTLTLFKCVRANGTDCCPLCGAEPPLITAVRDKLGRMWCYDCSAEVLALAPAKAPGDQISDDDVTGPVVKHAQR